MFGFENFNFTLYITNREKLNNFQKFRNPGLLYSYPIVINFHVHENKY